jgi:small subunit ribosomal protein S11
MAKKAQAKKIKKKKKVVHDLSSGNIYIQSSFNNTIVTLTDCNGNVLARESAGSMSFKGTKKSTPYAATIVAKSLGQKASDFKIPQYFVYICGVGSGRDSTIRALVSAGLNIVSISDTTPVPHNGCRSKKARRL